MIQMDQDTTEAEVLYGSMRATGAPSFVIGRGLLDL